MTSEDPTAFKAFEAQGWAEKALRYDELMGRLTRRTIEPLLDAASVGRGTRLLDVATGPGYAAAAAAARGATPTGIDISEGMVEVARRRYPELTLVQGDAERLPFAEGCFDAVVGNFVLNHLPQPERAVSEFARVLAPGGRLALSVWDVPARMRVLGVLVDAIVEVGAEPAIDLPPGPDPFRFADERVFEGLLRGAGFRFVAVRTFEFTHGFGGVSEYWDAILAGTVRTAALVRRRTAETQERIRCVFERRAAQYASAGGLELPAAAKISSWQRR
jgi:SAM-dependent methyltransferase